MDQTKTRGMAIGSRYGVKVLVALTFALFSFYYVGVARRTDISFDGAIFLQPVVSLERFGVLSHTYDMESPAEFHPPLTNLGQGMLSQAILNWPFIHFFGIEHFPLQASNLLFLGLGAALICLLTLRLTGNWAFALTSVLLFYTMPQMKVLGLGGLGEVPGTCYLLIAILLLHRSLSGARCYGWLGFVVFLAFHTKNYLILVYPVLLAELVYLAWRQKSVALRHIARFSAGFWTPMLFLPALFILKYGWDPFVSELSDYWLLFQSTQWGTTAARQPHTLTQTVEAVRELARNYGGWFLVYIPTGLTYILTLLALVLPNRDSLGARPECGPGGRIRSRLPVLDSVQAVILLMLALSVLYVAYWYHFSTFTLWYRRVLPFLILQIPMLLVSLHLMWARAALSRPGRRLVLAGGLAALLLLSVAHLRYFILVFNLPTPGELDLADRVAATELVTQLPAQAAIFGIGWWQAPRIALFSGRVFFDFLREGDRYREGYFVFDPEARAIAAETMESVLRGLDTKVVLKNRSYEVLKWSRPTVDLTRFPEDGLLELIRIGPDQAFSDGGSFYRLPNGVVAMWAMAKGATPGTVLVWEGQILDSTVRPDGALVTASVPRYLFSNPGSYSISLFDAGANRRSRSVPIRISHR